MCRAPLPVLERTGAAALWPRLSLSPLSLLSLDPDASSLDRGTPPGPPPIPRSRDAGDRPEQRFSAASLVRGTTPSGARIPRWRDLRRRDAVGVEDGVDVAERAQQAAELLHVADLGRVPVLRELVLDGPAVRDDVRTVLGERPGDVLEQALPVPGVDCDLHAEAPRCPAVPLDRGEAVGVLLQRADVRAVVAVDRDALAERDVADNVVARDRVAALREPDE